MTKVDHMLQSCVQECTMDAFDQFNSIFKEQKSFFFEGLINSTSSQRINKLKNIKSWIRNNEEAIKEALYLDLHKSGPEAEVTEIYPVISEINHSISHLSSWMKKNWVNTPLPLITTKTYVQAKPKGNSLIIAPWNFPFLLSIGPVISAISAGCTVVLKPSEHSPHTSELLNQMMSALFHEKEVKVMLGDAEVSKMLLYFPFNHIFFTGSPEIGSLVMQAAAKNLASVTLELGGCNPCIIDKTADLKDAAEKIVWGKFLNAGQSCVAPNYIMVPKELQHAFIEELKFALMEQFPHPIEDFELHHDYGRIVTEEHTNRLVELFEEVKVNGVVALGGHYNIKKKFFSPTIIEGLEFDSKLMNHEVFGPILGVYGYNNFENIPEYLYGKPQPLCAYIFSRSDKNIKFLTEQTQSGAVCINDTTIPFLHPETPFGGNNTSGIGKAHGEAGFLAFSNQRPVIKQSVGLSTTKLVFPPYTNGRRKIIKMIRNLFYS